MPRTRKPSAPATFDAPLPVIPLRDMVAFPGMKVPFIVGRASSVTAVLRALAREGDVFLVMQRDADVREPGVGDLHEVGTAGRIVHHVKLPDGTWKLLVEGSGRARAMRVDAVDGALEARVAPMAETDGQDPARDAAKARLRAVVEEHARLTGGSADGTAGLLDADEAGRACDDLAARLTLPGARKQEILDEPDVPSRLRKLAAIVQLECDRLKLDQKLQRQVQKQVEQAQREYLLNEKMKAIQKELGRKSEASDTEELAKRVEAAKLPAEAKEKALGEVRRLEAMPATSAEATVVRSYLDWMLAVPWSKRTRERRDFDRATQILDEDHHGLDKVKERILEFLAVRALQKGPARGSILCLVGPPGVGKTSLGRSIARATGRNFVRVSLGGVRDEAEIRGHRRTYIGAYPGRILQGMRRAKSRNPVFLLDEVDKLASDFRGDPSSALLEVLDPEQNSSFVDHYLDVGYDLSEVLFVCTANVLHGIPDALRDRLEVIRLPGYTLSEKVVIAERFLVPRQLEEHGLAADGVTITREALEAIVEGWTREAGVRSLEREIAALCRKAAARVVRERPKSGKSRLEIATKDDVRALLGAPRHRSALAGREPEVGVATGLAWTELGGQILHVEATVLSGRGKLLVTGQLGEVMQESLQAAVSYVRSRAASLAIDPHVLREKDLHVHVPEGAIPKDGPSAGITMATAVASALTGRPVRHDVAMTGEITLRGHVLPIGGVKEKLLAAHRAGIRSVLLPESNAGDLDEVPAEVRSQIDVTLVATMDDVLAAVLLAGRDADALAVPALPVPPPSSPPPPQDGAGAIA
jgi:ATP-dependent Lon protease